MLFRVSEWEDAEAVFEEMKDKNISNWWNIPNYNFKKPHDPNQGK